MEVSNNQHIGVKNQKYLKVKKRINNMKRENLEINKYNEKTKSKNKYRENQDLQDQKITSQEENLLKSKKLKKKKKLHTRMKDFEQSDEGKFKEADSDPKITSQEENLLKSKKLKKKRKLHTQMKDFELSDEEELKEADSKKSKKDHSHKGKLIKTGKNLLDFTNEETKPGKLSDGLKIQHQQSGCLMLIKADFEQSQEEELKEADSKKDHSHKSKLIKTKKNMLGFTNEEYKPGMLSESLQIKKFGRLIVPWDPSFGLDESFKIPVSENKDGPIIKINPLFDLSKRKDIVSQASGEKTQRSVFLGNLPSDCSCSDIKKLFKKCGKIHQIKIKNRKTSKNAYVVFKEMEGCVKALKLNGALFKDHHIRVDQTQNSCKSESRKSVFVGNLSFKTEDEDLWKAFESCGEIEGVRIIRDQIKGTGKGYGFVNFKTEEAVEKALKLDGTNILDRNVRVRRNETGAPELSKVLGKKSKKNKKKKSDSSENTDAKKCKPKNNQEDKYEETQISNETDQKKVKKKKQKQISHEDNEFKTELNDSTEITNEEMDPFRSKIKKKNKTEKE